MSADPVRAVSNTGYLVINPTLPLNSARHTTTSPTALHYLYSSYGLNQVIMAGDKAL